MCEYMICKLASERETLKVSSNCSILSNSMSFQSHCFKEVNSYWEIEMGGYKPRSEAITLEPQLVKESSEVLSTAGGITCGQALGCTHINGDHLTGKAGKGAGLSSQACCLAGSVLNDTAN